MRKKNEFKDIKAAEDDLRRKQNKVDKSIGSKIIWKNLADLSVIRAERRKARIPKDRVCSYCKEITVSIRNWVLKKDYCGCKKCYYKRLYQVGFNPESIKTKGRRPIKDCKLEHIEQLPFVSDPLNYYYIDTSRLRNEVSSRRINVSKTLGFPLSKRRLSEKELNKALSLFNGDETIIERVAVRYKFDATRFKEWLEEINVSKNYFARVSGLSATYIQRMVTDINSITKDAYEIIVLTLIQIGKDQNK